MITKSKNNKVARKHDALYRIWETLEADYTMKEVAKIISIPLPSFYRILKKVANKSITKEL